MAVLSVFNNHMLMAEAGTSLVITSDPISMAGANYVEVGTNIESLFNVGAAAGRLALEVRAGNDGQNWDASGITHSAAGAGMVLTGGDVEAAFIRVQYTYDCTAGAAGDISAATFDCHVNLIKK